MTFEVDLSRIKVRRKVHHGYYTEVKTFVGEELKVTVCCCKAAGASRRECADAMGNKCPCRCHCHSKKL